MKNWVNGKKAVKNKWLVDSSLSHFYDSFEEFTNHHFQHQRLVLGRLLFLKTESYKVTISSVSASYFLTSGFDLHDGTMMLPYLDLRVKIFIFVKVHAIDFLQKLFFSFCVIIIIIRISLIIIKSW